MAGVEAFRPVAVTRRGGLPECWHLGAVSVVAADGTRVAGLGDSSIATFARSAAKPFQAVAMLGLGLDSWGLDECDLALVCGSHSGTPEHTARAAALLARGGLDEGALGCGAHRPLDDEAARALDAAGELPRPLHNNCSGKHAGMLLACLGAGVDTGGYQQPTHPLQLRVREEIAAFSGLDPAVLGMGVDGCGVPTFQLPLAALARAYAALADPERSGHGGKRAEAARRVKWAMTAAPVMVAGRGRFTTRLMEATAGRLLAKEGAQGVFAVALSDHAHGLAVKIADGTETCRDAVVLEALRQLDALTRREVTVLQDFRAPTLRNSTGAEVGDVVVDFRLDAE